MDQCAGIAPADPSGVVLHPRIEGFEVICERPELFLQFQEMTRVANGCPYLPLIPDDSLVAHQSLDVLL